MALQSSGAISISQIKTELGSSSNSLRALSSAAGFGTPDAMSEFYGYSAAPPLNEGGNILVSDYMSVNYLNDFAGWQKNYIAGNSTNQSLDSTTAFLQCQFYSSTFTSIDLDFGWEIESEACCDTATIEVVDSYLGYSVIVSGGGYLTGTYYPLSVSSDATVYITYSKDGSVSEGSDYILWTFIGYPGYA